MVKNASKSIGFGIKHVLMLYITKYLIHKRSDVIVYHDPSSDFYYSYLKHHLREKFTTKEIMKKCCCILVSVRWVHSKAKVIVDCGLIREV